MTTKRRICVLGAGVIGMPTAYKLCLNYPGCDMTILYDCDEINTASYRGFGMMSMQVNGSKYESMRDIPWAIETFKFCKDVTDKSPSLAVKMGIEKVHGIRFVDNRNTLGEYKNRLCIWESKLLQDNCAIDFTKCTDEEMAPYRTRNHEFDAVFERKDVRAEDLDGYKFGSFIIDGPRYLPWLKSQMEEMNRKGFISSFHYEKRKVLSFSDLEFDYDVIVNCTGLGANSLCNDERIRPIKAQYIMLQDSITPNQNTFYYGAHTFTCPKPNRTLLGSVFIEGRYDDVIDPKHTASLLERNSAFYPDVKNSKIESVYTSVRPARIGGARVELDWLKLPHGVTRTELPVIHNYGHGAKGFMLHWGCANEVVRLFELVFKPTSKL